MNIDPVTPSEVASLGDDGLLGLQQRLAAARRLVDSASAVVAAEIQHRSRRELGYDGLAQRHGLRSGEALIQQVTGLSGSEARTLVRVGTTAVVRDAVDPTPWLEPVSAAVLAGAISVNAADVIRAGLGSPTDSVPASSLRAAAAQLVLACPTVTLDKLAIEARRLRDELDTAGIAQREEHRRERRYLNLTPQPDGMTRISGLLDPESAAIIVGAVDAITAPRRGVIFPRSPGHLSSGYCPGNWSPHAECVSARVP